MSDRPRFVLDTNVLVDAVCFARSFGRRAFSRATQAGVIVLSPAALAEFIEVMRRPRLQRYVTEEELQAFVQFLTEEAEPIAPVERIQACRDPKDDKFLELAWAAKAAAILSRDDDLLALHPFRGIDILTPQAFVEAAEPA